ISSKTGVRRITEPGVTARSTPTSNASGSTMAGMRGAAAMSLAKCRMPVTALPPPVSTAAFRAAGFSSGLLLGASASSRLVRMKPMRSVSAGPRPASAITPSAVPPAARYACIARRSSGLPAHPGSVNRRSRRDGWTCEVPAAIRASSPSSRRLRLATSPGRPASAVARRNPEPPGFTRRSMPMAALVSSRSMGAVAASAAADLIVSLSGFMISVLPPSVRRGRFSSIGLASQSWAHAWFRGHRTSSQLPLGRFAVIREDPLMDMDADGQGIAELASGVAAAVPRQAVSADVFQAIVREIPQLEEDKPLLALLASSVDSNVDTCLQIMQHRIDVSAVQPPAAAVEYACRLAQRGVPLTSLLRAYRLGHARFSDWLLKELARHADDARVISATTLSMSGIVAAYVDQTSEEMVAAYTQEREHWLRNQNAARAARVRRLLSGDRGDVRAAEAILGYRLRQYHVGVVCWVDDASGPVVSGPADELTRLERA